MDSKIPKVFVNFSRTLFNVDPNSSEEYEALGNEHDEESEIWKHSQNWNFKSYTLLQILYRGTRKTLLHMVGESVHEKCERKH